MRPTSQFNTFTISEASKIIGNIPATKNILAYYHLSLFACILQ